MVDFLSPKVGIIEKDPELRGIRGVATATAGIAAIFERGPVLEWRFVTNPAEFKALYGGKILAGYGPNAVDGFFRNGGKFLYVSRVVHYTDVSDPATNIDVAATVTLKDTLAVDTLQVDALYGGAWGNDLKIIILAPTSTETDEINLQITEDGILRESWPNVSMTDTDPNYVETLLNATDGSGSQYVVVTDLDSASASPADLPLAGTFSLMTGDDGLTSIADVDFIGDIGAKTGFFAFDQVQDIRTLLSPDRLTVAAQTAMQDYAETTRDGSMVAIIDIPLGNTAAQAKTWMDTTAALYNRSEYSYVVWPWIKIPNPSEVIYGKTADGTILVPFSGHVAGMWARTDAEDLGGIYKAAAGVERGKILGMVGVETNEVLDVTKRDLIYPVRINPATKLPGQPFFLHGSVTSKDNGRFPFINQRRGVIFIELSIQEGLIFAMHTNNDRKLRASIDRSVYNFLLAQYNNGAFAGNSPEESFTLDADIPGEGINNAAEQFAGRVNVEIGLAMVAPAQFVRILVSPDQRKIQEALQV